MELAAPPVDAGNSCDGDLEEDLNKGVQPEEQVVGGVHSEGQEWNWDPPGEESPHETENPLEHVNDVPDENAEGVGPDAESPDCHVGETETEGGHGDTESLLVESGEHQSESGTTGVENPGELSFGGGSEDLFVSLHSNYL